MWYIISWSRSSSNLYFLHVEVYCLNDAHVLIFVHLYETVFFNRNTVGMVGYGVIEWSGLNITSGAACGI
ncbi:hypothetical protein DBV15_09348 [Temnothorax longispinosus]|uniref:Uncharacterized protein n=1 Tax=Temnothorax longispinosus TaxID=300112 RepID=A0A4S2L5F4_9HYME|nr:hypothetical protein DBV15_09348 [Temnothorax longispinosus]